ncbi:MAG TPA: hypothetical protein H9870_11365 [Candidatus Corynebacterium avicola]|uniref:Uncharacterized protein n=1 Tax=Candidatus Corynebacterium avicola TaxID=2838527 RepID=A0A9D1RRI7_9CORY|nr:hypothetical protein [Candidatus Corynebacterium avicola]
MSASEQSGWALEQLREYSEKQRSTGAAAYLWPVLLILASVAFGLWMFDDRLDDGAGIRKALLTGMLCFFTAWWMGNFTFTATLLPTAPSRVTVNGFDVSIFRRGSLLNALPMVGFLSLSTSLLVYTLVTDPLSSLERLGLLVGSLLFFAMAVGRIVSELGETRLTVTDSEVAFHSGLLRSFSIGLRRCTGVSVMSFRAGQMVALSESGRRGSRMIQPSAFPDINMGIVKALIHERQ